jgi:hypothetical protein
MEVRKEGEKAREERKERSERGVALVPRRKHKFENTRTSQSPEFLNNTPGTVIECSTIVLSQNTSLGLAEYELL